MLATAPAVSPPPALVPQRGAIVDADVAIGTPALRGAVSGLLDRAGSTVHLDAFRISDSGMVDALMALPGRRVAVDVLADTDASVGPQADRLRAMAGWHDYGVPPRKQHGKSITRDGGAEALVATDVADAEAARRIELGVRFDGPAAAALAEVHAQSKASSPQRLRDALEAAAAVGVAINDPRVGARHASDALIALLQAAPPTGPVRIVTKAFDSGSMASLIAGLAAPGREVDLLTHEIPDRQRRQLEEAGVEVRVVGERRALRAARGLHGTVATAGDSAYIGSLYLVDRVLDGSSVRQSREAGVVLAGPAAAQARDAVAAIHAAQG
ncbi:MAG: hypothetical protein JWM86_165 [Thermoleophilia bacterium]|nr:hypothetical protein [Thermoleophilia bacterium]